jgi:hypothetical protein
MIYVYKGFFIIAHIHDYSVNLDPKQKPFFGSLKECKVAINNYLFKKAVEDFIDEHGPQKT